MKFVIVSPSFNHKSEGVVVLHELAVDLKTLGFDSRILLIDVRDPSYNSFLTVENAQQLGLENHNLIIKNSSELSGDDIFIYPEIISGNPLNAKNIVRYFLNKEKHMTGVANKIDSSDFIATFHADFFPEPVFVLSKNTFNLDKLINLDLSSRDISATYFGKGKIYSDGSVINSTVDLGLFSVKAEYENFLKLAKFVYTYDPYTGVIRDAILFGAIPVVLNHSPWSSMEISRCFFEMPVVDLVDRSNLHYIHDNFSFLADRARYIQNIRISQEGYSEKLIEFVGLVLRHFNI